MGLPRPDRLTDPQWKTEVERLWEFTGKNWKRYPKHSPINLDDLAMGMRDKGFDVRTIDDALQLIERVLSGEDVRSFGDSVFDAGDSGRDAAGNAATFSIGVEWTGFEGDPAGAIQKLKDEKKGVAIGVLSHPEVEGRIDLPWGEYDPDTDQGYGLKKILEKDEAHARTLGDLQGFLDGLTQVKRKGENRIILGSEDGTAAIRLDYNGEARNWLMTAFYRDKENPGGTTNVSGASPQSRTIPDEAISDESLGLNSRKVKQIDTPAFKSWFGVIPKWSMRTASRWWFIILNSEVRGQRTEASG